MGKGYDGNQERLAVVQGFGKDLARRAKSRCELSLQNGVALRIYEVPPVPKEADFERCLLLSEVTIAALAKPSLLVADEWRHLGELIWSENVLQQAMACRVLKYLARKHDWCAAILEEVYLDDDVLGLAGEAPLL